MSEKQPVATTTPGVGVLGMLGVLFVGLKLTHVINWSWWLVLLPFWGPLGAWLGLIVAVVIFVTIQTIIQEIQISRRMKRLRKKG